MVYSVVHKSVFLVYSQHACALMVLAEQVDKWNKCSDQFFHCKFPLSLQAMGTNCEKDPHTVVQLVLPIHM